MQARTPIKKLYKLLKHLRAQHLPAAVHTRATGLATWPQCYSLTLIATPGPTVSGSRPIKLSATANQPPVTAILPLWEGHTGSPGGLQAC